MLDRKKLEQELRALNDPMRCAAFAARISLLAMPFLAVQAQEKGAFWYWREAEREKYLLAVLRASQAAWGVFWIKDRAASVAAADAAASDASDASDAAFAAYASAAAAASDASSAFAASDAAAAAAFAAYASAAAASDAAAFAAAAANASASDAAIINLIWHELDLLKSGNNLITFLCKPLSVHGGISRFKKIFLSCLHNLPTFDYWADWLQDRYDGKPIDGELLEKSILLPDEIQTQSPAQINAYLKQLRDGQSKKLNKVRAIFIGFGAAGKTSLIRVLNGQPVLEGHEEMTAGIDISDWSLPDSDITAHLWDFGGQVMAHATHQFFLRARCVYVLVLDGRTEINANAQAEYWLDHVRVYGHGAPVLLVGNKSDQVRINLDMHYLKDKHPNIVDFYALSCTRYAEDEDYRRRFDLFRAEFVRQLQAVGTHQVYFGPAHFAVFEDLRKRSSAEVFLKKSTYEWLCGRHKVSKDGELNRVWLLKLLDDLGVIIHFADIPTLDAFLLNPRWLTYGIYTLIYSGHARDKAGRLSLQDVTEILQAKKVVDNLGNTLRYRPEECGFIVRAMERFQLCYPLPDTPHHFILPDLLPSDRPADLQFDKTKALAFDFDFEGLLPRHLMTAFTVRHHQQIRHGLVWQNGVRLHAPAEHAEALVQADYHERRLSLWVTGEHAQHFFYQLHGNVLEMLKHLDLRYREWVRLPDGGDNMAKRAPFLDLLAQHVAGQKYYYCAYGQYEMTEVLKIMPEEKQQGVNIHIGGSVGNFGFAGRDMSHVRIGSDDNAQIRQQLADLETKLDTWYEQIAEDVEDTGLRKGALSEVKEAREAVRVLQQQNPPADALQTFSRFGDVIKESGSKLVGALKTLKTGGEAIGWLQATVPALTIAVAKWLS